MRRTALVLGAGGITGVAWQLGLLAGLRDEGTDLTGADLIVGTSAGALTGALVASGHDPLTAAADLLAGPADPPMRADWARGALAFGVLQDRSLPELEARRRIGAIALEAEVGLPEPWVESFTRRLPVPAWPARLTVTAVDAVTGEPVVWTAESGVPLASAVAASCAVPCLFPPVPVNGSRYMDGGVRSRTNVDLAAGYDRVVVLAPRIVMLQRETALPGAVVVEPDQASQTAIGSNVFDQTRWSAVLAAAVTQGHTTKIV